MATLGGDGQNDPGDLPAMFQGAWSAAASAPSEARLGEEPHERLPLSPSLARVLADAAHPPAVPSDQDCVVGGAQAPASGKSR